MTRLAAIISASLLAGATLAGGPAYAQEEEETDPWDLAVEFGLNGASGNSSFTILRGGFTANRVETDLFELDFRAVVRYGKNEERVIADDAKASARFDWRPSARFSPFVLADIARDEIRRLDLKSTGGVGAKWSAIDRPNGDLSLSLAGIYDYQNFKVEPMSGDPESESQIRWSARLKGERSFGDGATYEHVTFYQPVVDDFGDYVIEITNSVTTTLIGNLSLAVEHLYLRDSAPPPGAAADDQKYSVLFRLAF